jgi:hypothetical protein
MARLFAVSLLILTGCGEVAERPVAPPAPAPTRTFADHVAPLLQTYCVNCHAGPDAAANLDFKDIASVELPDMWIRVADALRTGSMPPLGKPRPGKEAIEAARDWIENQASDAPSSLEPAPVTIRRLNRFQYDNTVRDLIGLDLPLSHRFPLDDSGYGFDSVGDVLTLPPVLLEKYLEAADMILEAAWRDPSSRSRILNPAPDVIPPRFRSPTFATRNPPDKRVGIPPPRPVESEAVIENRRVVDILRGFADRAFRRPATQDELTRLFTLYESARKDSDDRDQAIQHALKSVLIAPSFLFRVEPEAPGGPSRPLGDFELASRLSYFLWSSMPDAELFALAANGQLASPSVRALQVERMLRDPRARALASDFAPQWLQLRGIADASPDPSLFPRFDEELRASMRIETELFCRSIIQENLSIFTFLDSDFTFINDRLAQHYGIAGVTGPRFRRVSLEGTLRRGVWSQASVLLATSNPSRTSPVKRGRWILDALLGDPPPPPPSDAEGLAEVKADHPPTTVRQRLERHRAEPRCASCHQRIDPLGFALENFDATGAWRDHDGTNPIDATGQWTDDRPIDGPSGLHAFLISRREDFARRLAEKLLTYALGRAPRPEDHRGLRAIARKLTHDDPRFSTLVLAIVESPAFLNRAGSRNDHP